MSLVTLPQYIVPDPEKGQQVNDPEKLGHFPQQPSTVSFQIRSPVLVPIDINSLLHGGNPTLVH